MADPWDVFGSDSDEEISAVSTPTPARSPPPRPKRHHRRYAWESLLPKFQFPPGFDEKGGGEAVGREGEGDLGKRPTAESVVGEDAEEPAASAPFSAPPVFQHPSVRYEACLPHRGGGRGFVASADIAPGTLLLLESRFLPMPTAFECGLAGGVGQEELCLQWILELPPARLKEVLGELRWLHPQSLQDLPESEAAELMLRHEETAKVMLSKLKQGNSATTTATETATDVESLGLDVRGIVRLFGALQSNGFASGIYLHPAMTNHSCRPNAIKWRAGQSIADRQVPRRKERQEQGDDPVPTSEIRATELIRKGEEITISYLEPREIALESRQARLKDQFGFYCDCVLCKGKTQDNNKIRNTISNTSTTASTGDGFVALEAFVEHHQGFSRHLCQEEGEDSGRNRARRAPNNDTAVNGAGGGRKGEEAMDAGEGGIAAGGTGNRSGLDNGDEGEDAEGEEAQEEEEEDYEGLVARNVLERRLEAAESVVDLSRAKEVRWAGVLSEVLGYRRHASRWLSARHISLARADKLIAKACIAVLQGSTEAAESDAKCAESVQQISDELPASFGGKGTGGNALPSPGGCFKTRLLAVFVAALISRRKTQLLYLGDGPHPEAGACLADLSQAMGMLLAQGSEGKAWVERLPGDDRTHDDDGFKKSEPAAAERGVGDGLWWCDGGGGSASLFERECEKAAKRIGRLFDAPQPKK